IEWSFYAVIAVTIVSGTYPAWKASMILPVGRIIGAPRQKRRIRKGRLTDAEKVIRESVERGVELSKRLPQISPLRLGTLRQRVEQTRLREIAKTLREELRLKHPPTIKPSRPVEPSRKVEPSLPVEPEPTVEAIPTITPIPIPKSRLPLVEEEVERPKLRLSEQLAKSVRELPEKSGVLSFMVPDQATLEIAESILQWLPEGTQLVEATTADAEKENKKLVNSVIILCYSPISVEIENFLTYVPDGSFKIVLVPSSTFERLSSIHQSEINWTLEARIRQKKIKKSI
ncbi:MAG: hypothetical protein JSW01_06240, partial [Candidatus Bathyarchaeota archaeon]